MQMTGKYDINMYNYVTVCIFAPFAVCFETVTGYVQKYMYNKIIIIH